MADTISNKTEQTAADVAAADLSITVDVSAGQLGTKKIKEGNVALAHKILRYFADTGDDDAYVISTGLSLSTLTAGMSFTLKPTTANTGACTLAIDSVAAVAIKVANSVGLRDPFDNEIAAGSLAVLTYNGTYFVLENPQRPAFITAAVLPTFDENKYPDGTFHYLSSGNLFRSNGIEWKFFNKLTDIYDVDRTLIFGHRGCAKSRPENTLLAFETAIQGGADGIELDVRLTQDDKLIIMHDETTGRTADEDLTINAEVYSRLRQLDAGSWFSSDYAGEKIPLLSDVFEKFGNTTKYFIEIKDRGMRTGKLICELIDKFCLWDNCILYYVFNANDDFDIVDYLNDTVFPTLKKSIPIFANTASIAIIPDVASIVSKNVSGIFFGAVNDFPKIYSDDDIATLQNANVKFALAQTLSPTAELLHFIINWGVTPDIYVTDSPTLVKHVLIDKIPLSQNGKPFFTLTTPSLNEGINYSSAITIDTSAKTATWGNKTQSGKRLITSCLGVPSNHFKVDFNVTFTDYNDTGRWFAVNICKKDDSFNDYAEYQCLQRFNGSLEIYRKADYPTGGNVVQAIQANSALTLATKYAMRVTVTATTITFENVTNGWSVTLTDSELPREGFVEFFTDKVEGVIDGIIVTDLS